MLGLPIHLEATELEIWDGALTVERASARLAVFSLLSGHPRLSRLMLDGAHLRIERAADDEWSPLPFAQIAEAPRPPDPEPVLAPLRVIDGTVRFLLAKPFLADTLIVERSRVTYVHDFADSGGEVVTLDFGAVQGMARHSSLRRDADLFLRTRLASAEGPAGSLEWEGARSSDGEMRVSMAATAFRLSTFLPHVRSGRLGPPLHGRLSGIADYRNSAAGEASLDLDLVAHDLEVASAVGPDSGGAPMKTKRFAIRGRVGIDPEHLEIASAELTGDALSFGLDAVIARPLGAAASVGVTLTLRDLDLDRARQLIGWLPEPTRGATLAIARKIVSGRVARIAAAGAASVEAWLGLLSGRASSIPTALRVGVDVDELAIRVGEADSLEGLSGRLEWVDDVLTVHRARADLNGAPLPSLNLQVVGISHLFASDPGRRLIASGAMPLRGLTPLWESLRPGPAAAGDPPPVVDVVVEHVDHPALLWPIEDAQVRLEPTEDGLDLTVDRGRWAGVPMRGAMAARLAQPAHIAARFVAGPDAVPPAPEAPAEAAVAAGGDISAPAPEPREAPVWVRGRFQVGSMAGTGWRQRSARGRFEAALGTVYLDDLEIELEPTGTLAGNGHLDLSQPDRVPFALSASLVGGDVAALFEQSGAEDSIADGRVDLRGALEGDVVPGRSIFAGLSGDLMLEASDGSLQRSVPAIVAVALASEALNAMTSRDEIRYSRCVTALRFQDGLVTTDAFDIDGPDLRMFASGRIDMAAPTHPVDAEVVLFLFRPIDRALGYIPILNDFLLGQDESFAAAYFELAGPWEEPIASAQPLRTLTQGPGGDVIMGIPRVVERGVRALGGLLGTTPVPVAPTGGPPHAASRES